MGIHNDCKPGYEPLLLLRNTSYPIYQLYAVAGNGKIAPNDVLTIAVLETMHWLRQRFRAFEIPLEINWPDASKYAEVDCNTFQSFQIDVGYKVEVVWLPEEKIWAFQLTEPDLGANPGMVDQSRLPVPGRIIETNIAYKICGEHVECGFRTMVSEPIGVTSECEVFRLAFIKLLARNSLVGLRQKYSLLDTAHLLDSNAEIKSLQSWIKDNNRMMPAVVFSECETTQISEDLLPSISDFVITSPAHKSFTQSIISPVGPQKKSLALPFDISNLTRYRMGYAQFFILQAAKIEAFQKATGQVFKAGDIILFEPAKFGGEVMHYPYVFVKENPEAAYEKLEKYIQNYPKKKEMKFGQVVFLPDAKVKEREKIINSKYSKEEIILNANEKEKSNKKKYNEDINKLKVICNDKDEQISHKNKQIEKLEDEKTTLQERIKMSEKDCCEKLDAMKAKIDRKQALLERPNHPNKVADWVKSSFEGKLILHQRAKEMMQNIAPSSVDLGLLCDSLEFLAIDYREKRLGLINEEQMMLRCVEKYKHRMEVVPNSICTIDAYPRDYKINYCLRNDGKLEKVPLNLHLRFGRDSDYCVRIYFLFDKEKGLIVVGSLPNHLHTVSHD